jgi:hypothetical protein
LVDLLNTKNPSRYAGRGDRRRIIPVATAYVLAHALKRDVLSIIELTNSMKQIVYRGALKMSSCRMQCGTIAPVRRRSADELILSSLTAVVAVR